MFSWAYFCDNFLHIFHTNVPLIFHSLITTSLFPSASNGSMSSLECSVSFKCSYSIWYSTVSSPLLYSLQFPLFCSGPIFTFVENFNWESTNLKNSLQVRMLFLLDGKYQSVVSPNRATYLRPLQEGQLPQQLLFRHWYW